MNGTVAGGDGPVITRPATVLAGSSSTSPLVAGVATPTSGPATPDLSTESEATDSDAAADGTRSRSSTGPMTRTTITTTSNAAGDLAQGQATTIQYSNVSNVELDTHVEKDGTIHLKPVQARKDRKVKIKKVIQFVPRISHFDRDHPDSRGDTFRGFYVLFWMLMGLALIRTFYHSYLNTGEVVGTRFAKLITGDAIVLALSDGVLVGITILCVPFIKLVETGWIRYHYTGLFIQHSLQCLYLASAIRWTFHRHWYWVQSGFLTLHSLTMLMKVHSYLAMNGAMAEKRIQLNKTKKKLDEAVEEQGGWSKVLYQVSRETSNTDKSPNGDAPSDRLGVSSAVGRAELSPTSGSFDSGLSRRRRSSNRSNSSDRTEQLSDPKDPRRLVEYSDETIYNLANDCVDLQEDLTSTGKEAITWPANVTYANYVDYLLVPSLVYELEYPRTNTIRPLYVLEKTLATFGTFFVIYAITEHVIFPSHEASKANPIRADSFIGAALDLILPFMLNYLLIFYIIFECICNGFAELTRFADRGFYEDWWNAVTWDEFARKWNKPVHQFLLRHVYASTIKAFRLSKFQASFLTFLLSACVHELVMAVVSKKFRMYLFAMQMAQLPMIAIGRLPILRRYPTIGNISFWAGLIWGFPLLAIGYLRF